MTFKILSAAISRTATASSIGALRMYQKTHILRAPSCRFYPSCSQYMVEGIQRFGLTQGFFLGLGRLCRCHPLNLGGVDEVPDHQPFNANSLASSLANVLNKANLKKFGFRFLTSWKHGALESPRGSR